MSRCRFKIKYNYNKPKTAKEKESQQKILKEVYNLIFNRILDMRFKEKIKMENENEQ